MGFEICAIGCGRHASMVHGPSLRRYENERDEVELSACCDTNIKAAEEYAAEFGFGKAYADWETMVKKGIPCLMEKPPALTAGIVISLPRPYMLSMRSGSCPVRITKDCASVMRISPVSGRASSMSPWKVPCWKEPGRIQVFAGGSLEETVTGHQISDGEEMFESCGFYSENASFCDRLREGKEVTDGVETARQSVEVAQFFRERKSEYIS